MAMTCTAQRYRTPTTGTFRRGFIEPITNPSSVRNSFATPGPVGDMCHDGTEFGRSLCAQPRIKSDLALGLQPIQR